MWSAYAGGFRAMLRRWRLVLALWLVGVAVGGAFALAAQAWLALALDGSLATRTLAHHLDPDVFVDLWYHHGEGLRMLAAVAAVLATLHALLWWYLDGVVVVAVRGDAATPWRDGVALAPVMARLALLAWLVALAWSGAVAGPAWAALRSTREHPGAFVWYQIAGAALVLWLPGMALLVAVHDHARLRAGLTGAGAWRAYAWAARFVGWGGQRAAALALALQLSAAGLFAVGEYAAMTPAFDVTASLLVGEVALLARSALRVWFFTAQRRLQP
ncbi:MAG: hypothetical protein U0802_17250 [Candidatus Binatia bacterium]